MNRQHREQLAGALKILKSVQAIVEHLVEEEESDEGGYLEHLEEAKGYLDEAVSSLEAI